MEKVVRNVSKDEYEKILKEIKQTKMTIENVRQMVEDRVSMFVDVMFQDLKDVFEEDYYKHLIGYKDRMSCIIEKDLMNQYIKNDYSEFKIVLSQKMFNDLMNCYGIPVPDKNEVVDNQVDEKSYITY